MNIAVLTFRLHAPWVHSLKEKRMIVRSLIAKLQNKFHVSAAEVDEQDTHQIIDEERELRRVVGSLWKEALPADGKL